MLSGETASGDHPIAAVETMVKIANATEAGLVTSGGTPGALVKFRSTRAVAHAGVECQKWHLQDISWLQHNMGMLQG